MEMESLGLDYRVILRGELTARQDRNPRYSLRAFARDLDISPSRLSEILNGKQGLSRESAQRIGERLGMGGAEREIFCDLVDSAHARSPAQKQVARDRLQAQDSPEELSQLQQDVMRLVSRWCPFYNSIKFLRGLKQRLASQDGSTPGQA